MRADQARAAGIDARREDRRDGLRLDPSHPDTPASRYQPVSPASGTYVDGTPFSVSGAMNGNNDLTASRRRHSVLLARRRVGMYRGGLRGTGVRRQHQPER